MGVSRSGYYKWKNRGRTSRDQKREEVIRLVTEVHKAHPSHGYRWVCHFIIINYKVDFSENYVYKAFRYLGFKSETKHQVHYRPRKVKDKYPNLICVIFILKYGFSFFNLLLKFGTGGNTS